jgi:hypothetical protein
VSTGYGDRCHALLEKLLEYAIRAPCLSGRERQAPLLVQVERILALLVSNVMLGLRPCVLEKRLDLQLEEFGHRRLIPVVVDQVARNDEDVVPSKVPELPLRVRNMILRLNRPEILAYNLVENI